MPQLALLGGSSPFTVAWVDAVADSPAAIAPHDLVLHGRNAQRLDLVAGYARSRLVERGWSVRTSTSLERALDGADVVLHQVRYGGLAARARDEELAARFGIPGDETLGPAGLQAGLRLVPHLRRLAEEVRRRCPEAWVLNLSNPLSLAVAVLHREGVDRALGLCELPRMTAARACRRLGLDPAAVEWSYTGLNHRGFVHHLTYEGRDLLPELGPEDLEGIPAEVVASLGALPLKYFRLLLPGVASNPGRPAFLSALADRAVAELQERPTRRPPALDGRGLEWYAGAVVPLLAALTAGDGRVEVVSTVQGGIAVEVKARIFPGHIEPIAAPDASAAVRGWMRAFVAHERAALVAALDPTPSRLEAALALDPLVPPGAVKGLAWALERASVPRDEVCA
jgi:6-phospho-beta-glucosidase